VRNRKREADRSIRKGLGKWKRRSWLAKSVEGIFFPTTFLVYFVFSSHSALLGILAGQCSISASLAWRFSITLYTASLDSETKDLIKGAYLGFPTPTLLARLGGTHPGRVGGLAGSRGTVVVLLGPHDGECSWRLGKGHAGRDTEKGP
jgi:hypothetical protein